MANDISKKDLFTGGKLPEFTVFYNMAFFKIAGLINHLQGEAYEEDKQLLEKKFKNFLRDSNDPKHDRVFLKLRDYLWKGYGTNKNSSGYVLNQEDKVLIVSILWKLIEVRNFHSHYWHDNSVLAFSEQLYRHIQNLHEEAKFSFMGEFPHEVSKYELKLKEKPLFRHHERQYFISQEGRVFFLSFFLTRGEMARFLQQSKGFKRNDTPEFKIKHLIYRFYTHRDGTARQHYGQEENVLSGLPSTEKTDILAARQAFKLISYLNDVPTLSHNTDLFPLYLDSEIKVQNAQDLIVFCRKNNWFNELIMSQLVKEKLAKKGSGEDSLMIEKEHYLDISLNNFHIHLSQNAFHRLLLDSLRKEDNGQFVLDKLQKFTEERLYLYALITKESARTEHLQKGETNIEQEFDQYYRFKLRSGEQLREKMGFWLEKIDYNDLKGRALEKLNSFQSCILENPIEVNYYDFYFKDEEKPRSFDQFMNFSISYLIDFQIVPDWCWLYERFEPEEEIKEKMVNGRTEKVSLTVNKRRTMFSATKPILSKSEKEMDNSSDWRLSITDGQVLVGIYKGETEADRLVGKAPKNKFLLGHRAVKNLLITSIENGNIQENELPKINDFFEDIITDIDSLKNQGQLTNNSFKILTANEIPDSFLIGSKNKKPFEIPELHSLARERIDKLIAELSKLLLQKDKKPTVNLNRAEKNRQIMRCYKYFDWEYPQQSEFKFLRKDEYQQMSVYHYCLEKRRNNDLQRGDYAFLIEKALPHIPEVIKGLLRTSKNIDELLEKTIIETIDLLENWAGLISIMKGKTLVKRLNKLGISSYKESILAEHIPFDIHPILILRKYFPDELANGKFSLSARIWGDSTLRTGTRKEHYNIAPYLKEFNISTNAPSKKRKLVGEMNELITQDVLLWMIAKKYINKTSAAYRGFITGGNSQDQWNISNLRQTEIQKPFDAVGTYGEVILKIKFHQLDDYLLVESKPVIKLALEQVMMRYEYLKREDAEKLKNMNIKKTEHGNYVVPYEEVFKEIQRVFNDSVHCAGELLRWEKQIIESMTDAERLECENRKISEGQKAFINFWEVLQKANYAETEKATLKDIRNTAFHGKIPKGWSYRERIENGTFWDLFGYVPKPQKNYENTNK